MNHFTYHGDEMYCEEVAVEDIAAEVGTPFYLYSHATLTRHYLAFDGAFDGVDRLVCYSAKANSNMAVMNVFRNLGSGLDIVSGGELYRGLNAGFPPERIVYSGVGKRTDEIDYALKAGILLFNVESLEELKRIDERAGRLNRRAAVAIRVNPDVDPQTHPYISTGLEKNKFGIDTDTALRGYETAAQLANIDPVGIDCHIGSQITDVAPFGSALESILNLYCRLVGMGIDIRFLDMGGGLGITYEDESPPDPADYADAIIRSLGGSPLQLILEPGRVLVGNAGILVTRVLYRKSGKTKSFIIADAAMNDLLRPSLYGAFHAIKPIHDTKRDMVTADLVGPICESGDFLATDRSVPDLQQDDLLAVMSAGAYAFTMSSNYCSRPRIAEVMVKGDQFRVVKARETYEDLIAGESLPPFHSS